MLPRLVEENSHRLNDVAGPGTPHQFIEGDNFDSLQLLKSTHAGKIRVIYIDPPYNTGDKDWVYNDRYRRQRPLAAQPLAGVFVPPPDADQRPAYARKCVMVRINDGRATDRGGFGNFCTILTFGSANRLPRSLGQLLFEDRERMV